MLTVVSSLCSESAQFDTGGFCVPVQARILL